MAKGGDSTPYRSERNFKSSCSQKIQVATNQMSSEAVSQKPIRLAPNYHQVDAKQPKQLRKEDNNSRQSQSIEQTRSIEITLPSPGPERESPDEKLSFELS